ncbi:ArfGap-domain-containing protein [Metschnikowia bicuspidata var. bicuspidata NRRL YB-4993]|uniref:ADP-ribosylation factor GTPase-activating protein n=1 Tax=Metschnikowia bicuspidata var. bicuspidata NRRL YB-4993 TaxID=869754 RepID=A0A1A0H1Y2_9ASCO|nr:ArfGap-domain-containing protein [Metschnikowia bicuspidata var. bicuspidata NRRL YB-4993]OBA18039.1 ArfGap-domain-containing protein [Metschnikowia bicuspidata var. bicuspidata NRRL YB-4993]
MASEVFPLAFNYVTGESHIARLVKLALTDETNLSRIQVSLNNDICSKITHTSTCLHVEKQIKYISNNAGLSPLLLVVSASHNKLKFEVDVLHAECESESQAFLVIHKSYGTDSTPKLLLEQMLESLLLKLGDASKIPLSELALDDQPQTVVVNDCFSEKKAQNSVLTISAWHHSEAASRRIFSFQIWVEEDVSKAIHVAELAPDLPKRPPRQPTSLEFDLTDLRKAFNFNIHDGPEFRTTLAVYEQDTPKLKKAMLNFQDEVRGLEMALKRLVTTRNCLLDTLEAVLNYQFNPLLKKSDLHKKFSAALKSVFEPLVRNLTFIIKEVFAAQSIPKMISYCMASTSADGSYETASSRKSFEKQSKEYYDWLHKYLSNEKDRPELKLLLKRKAFELSKFDYLNALNASSNNQYFNQLLENLFKFSNLPQIDGLLNFRLFQDKKNSPCLLPEKASLFLNGLSRFNSEKLQFRQMIEACRTNEELTTVIKSNALNSASAHQSDHTKRTEKLSIDTSSVNLDMIFPNLPLVSSPKSESSPKSPWAHVEDDQNANYAGILYALGGQGKPGWHKEWVVLKKGQLIEYSDWRNGTQPINRPIDIALASVKPVTKEKRQFCLEIMTSLGQRHVFQAINEDERSQWIKALYNAGQLTDRLIGKAPKPSIITDFPKPPAQVLPADDGRGLPVSVFSELFHLTDENLLQNVRSIAGSENGRCADCNSTETTEWVSMTFSVVICVKCSSCHRNMGSHISKVKSLKLDNFFDESRILLTYMNNALVNSYLEAMAPQKLDPDASDAQRLQYIKQKYENRAFMAPVGGINALLVKATRKIDIHEVIKWLNCGADPNLTLEMSNLQWSDPLTVTLFEYSLRKRIEVEEEGKQRGYFVISELLLLHGCLLENIRDLHPRIVGREDAKSYWMKKRSRSLAP